MSNNADPNVAAALSYRQTGAEDLELLLAWRSNPRVYEHFRNQDRPLSWEEHHSWFESRSADRHDFTILYEERRVGSVFLTPDSFVGVYVGEIDLWGKGIGTAAVDWICTEFDREAFFAEIHAENGGSKRLFEGCGFTAYDRQDDWLIYRRQGTVADEAR